MKKLALIILVLFLGSTVIASNADARRGSFTRYLIKKIRMPKKGNYSFMSKVIVGSATGMAGAYAYDKLTEENSEKQASSPIATKPEQCQNANRKEE